MCHNTLYTEVKRMHQVSIKINSQRKSYCFQQSYRKNCRLSCTHSDICYISLFHCAELWCQWSYILHSSSLHKMSSYILTFSNEQRVEEVSLIVSLFLQLFIPTITRCWAHTSTVSFCHVFIRQWYTKEGQECGIPPQFFFEAASVHPSCVSGHLFTSLTVVTESIHPWAYINSYLKKKHILFIDTLITTHHILFFMYSIYLYNYKYLRIFSDGVH